MANTIYYNIKATITTLSGVVISLTSDDIVSYNISSSLSVGGIPVGQTCSSQFDMVISSDKVNDITANDLDDATVVAYASATETDTDIWKPFGVWYVQECEMTENSAVISLAGSDAMETKLSAKWSDTSDIYPITLANLAQLVITGSVSRLHDTVFDHASNTIPTKPNWKDGTTLRDVIGYIAACASGFARITLDGKLEIVSLDNDNIYEIGDDDYTEYSMVGGAKFDFNTLLYKYEATEEVEDPSYTRYTYDASKTDNATNCIQLEANPIVQTTFNTQYDEAWAKLIYVSLRGVAFESAEFSWISSNIGVMVGDIIVLTDTNGIDHTLILTGLDTNFSGGIIYNGASDMPSIEDDTQYFTTGAAVFNSDGSVNVNAISGLDKKVIQADYAYFNGLTAETVDANSLIAKIINAINLTAEKADITKLTADLINVNTFSAQSAEADTLKAAILSAISAKVGALTAESITTDTLAAAFATFLNLKATTITDTEEVQTKHLISDVFNVVDGIASGTITIKNLTVEQAQIMTGVFNTIVVKGTDDHYYTLVVNPDFETGIEYKDVTDYLEDEYGTVLDGAIIETEDGVKRKVLETDLSVRQLSVTDTLEAINAIIGTLTAKTISTDYLFSKEAFITKLKTAQLWANGTNLDIIASAIENLSMWYQFGSDGLTISKRKRNESTGEWESDSHFYTTTTNNAYKVKRDDEVGIDGNGTLNAITSSGTFTTAVEIGEMRVRPTQRGWVWTDGKGLDA